MSIRHLSALELAGRLLREVVIASPAAWVPRTAVLEEVQYWVEDEEPDERQPSNRQVYTALRMAGIPEVRRNGVVGFKGLRLREDSPETSAHAFLQACFWFDNPGAFASRVDIYDRYQEWRTARAPHGPELTPRQVFSHLRARGLQQVERREPIADDAGDESRVPTTRRRGFVGLTFNPNWLQS